MSIVIHIGWARAASTAFRQNFLMRHPDILSVDRKQQLSDGPAAATLHHCKSATASEFRHLRNGQRSAWAAFQRGRRDQILCITDEELSIGLPNRAVAPIEIAGRCAALFPGARVLAIVRDQVDAIRSFYILSRLVGHPRSISLSEWVQQFFIAPSEGKDFSYLFAHMATLSAYRSWCSKQDILVLPYERLKNSPVEAYRDVARWMGISEDVCALLPNEVVNVSPPILSLEQRGRSAGEPAPHYSAGQEDKIRRRFEADNRDLEREFGIRFLPQN
jgi:hypothetical protein